MIGICVNSKETKFNGSALHVCVCRGLAAKGLIYRLGCYNVLCVRRVSFCWLSSIRMLRVRNG